MGFINIGTCWSGKKRTSQNVVDVIIGKKLPEKIGGNFYLGGYSGSKAVGKNKQGFMLAVQVPFIPAKDEDGTEYNKCTFSADYASGKNYLGGGGVGFTYNFTPDISLLTGPVWFNSRKLYGDWKWTVQIGIIFSPPKRNEWKL